MYWVIQFDQVLDARNNSFFSECNDNFNDMSITDWLNYNKTENDISKILNSDPSLFNPPDNDSFGDNITSTDRWLLSIFLSYNMSIFISTPIIAYFLQLKYILCYKQNKDIDETYYFSLYIHFL